MVGQREESTVGQGTQGTYPNLQEIIGLVGRIANALESSQNNHQQSQVGESSQVRSVIVTDDLTLLERFVKLKPTVFAGGTNSDEVEEWIRFWWKTIDAKWTAGNVMRTWDLFTTEFNKKYIPASVRRDRELAFLQLEQKNKIVQEYEKEFIALARHASYLVEGGDRKARKSETGLNSDIQEAVAPLNIFDYHKIVDQTLNIESTLGFTRANRAHMSLSRPQVPQWQAGRFPSTSGDRKIFRTYMRSIGSVEVASTAFYSLESEPDGAGSSSPVAGANFLASPPDLPRPYTCHPRHHVAPTYPSAWQEFTDLASRAMHMVISSHF
ncbi:hypothetical protein RJ640_028780 [Escallonia rubra]|uniref:Retrotransposon gag domain-containing protein n=1 Tax=Escallonia rubra TaxID=112253 RepID=A0AA88U2Z9_9ASTE|nr:hypothetical protein RJ640_028780 [Escallonia rubra]